MTTSVTRRGLVAAAPAAAVAASLPASAAIGSAADPFSSRLIAGGHANAELLALREPWQRTLAAMAAVSADPKSSENAYDDAVDANTDVLDRIAATPARTFEGLLFKAQACAKADCDSDLAASIVADLVAMGGALA